MSVSHQTQHQGTGTVSLKLNAVMINMKSPNVHCEKDLLKFMLGDKLQTEASQLNKVKRPLTVKAKETESQDCMKTASRLYNKHKLTSL